MEGTRLIRDKLVFKIFPMIFSEFGLDGMDSRRNVNERKRIP